MEQKYVKLIQQERDAQENKALVQETNTEKPTEELKEASKAVVGFDEAFDKFLADTTKIYDEYMKKNFPKNPKEVIEAKRGKKYIKLIKRSVDSKSGSVHAFVSIDTGDVFKPASWAKPAKGARGNIYDNKGGTGRMTPYGPEYNR